MKSTPCEDFGGVYPRLEAPRGWKTRDLNATERQEESAAAYFDMKESTT